MNDSTTGGFLVPASSPAPVEGEALQNFFHDFIVGLTALDNTLVRPAYQKEPPNIPPNGTVWAAFNVVPRAADNFPYVGHISDGNGTDEMQAHEIIDVLVSFYGKSAGSAAYQVAAQFRDGMKIAQNLEYLSDADMGFLGTEDIVQVPSLVKSEWQNRADLKFSVRREIFRVYPVENILSAEITTENQNADDTNITTVVNVNP